MYLTFKRTFTNTEYIYICRIRITMYYLRIYTRVRLRATVAWREMFRKMKHPRKCSPRTLAHTRSLDNERIILPAAREKVNDEFAALRHAFMALSSNYTIKFTSTATVTRVCPTWAKSFRLSSFSFSLRYIIYIAPHILYT